MLAFLIVGLISGAIYYYLNRFRYWRDRGVLQTSKWECLWSNFQVSMKLKSFRDLHYRNYRLDQKLSRYIGFYQFGTPMLMIRDPELLKCITVKDREYFTERQPFIAPGNDPFWDSNLFALGGERWRAMRNTLSPAFTAIKMKAMFTLMDDTAKEFTSYFRSHGNHALSMKDVFRRFATDVIANCAFGQKVNSLQDPENEFYTNGVRTSNFSSFWRALKLAIGLIHRHVAKAIKVRAFDPETVDFFYGIVRGQMRVRREQNIVRPDMLHLLMEAQKGRLQGGNAGDSQDTGFATVQETDWGKDASQVDFTDVGITGQVMFFFIAGFDTMSTALSFTAYELALHPEIQNRLRVEIQATLEQCDGKLSYEALFEMKYMDMVISESLRKWPPALFTDRKLTTNYTIKKSAEYDKEEDVHLEPQTLISIPINAIHHDPAHWPNPENFDPERFNDVNKHRIKAGTYLPFGIGPRNCIGSRFALMEIKTIFFHLLRDFEIVTNAKTMIPVVVAKGLFNLDSVDGIQLSFRRLD